MKKISNNKVINKVFFTVISLLLLTVLVSAYMVYDNYKKEIKILENEKKVILNDLIKTKNNLEFVTAENKSLNEELSLEKQKVEALIEEINNSTLEISTILEYKNEVIKLNKVISYLKLENQNLKNKNKYYKKQRDSTILILSRSKILKDSIAEINTFITKETEKEIKLSLVSLKVETLMHKKESIMVSTSKANQVNALKISFFIQTKSKHNPFNKQHFIQIIDKDNNVLGLNKLKRFNNSLLYYSILIENKIDSELTQITEYIPVKKLKPGEYTVNIFDKDILVSKTNFFLK